jgi:hypothetical protein
MGRRTLLVGLAAGLFFATSVVWLAGSAYAGPQVEIKISAEEENRGCLASAECRVTQLKIEVACPAGLLGAGCTGTVECEYDPRVGPVEHPITSVTLNGRTLQFRSGAGVEAEWAFGVVAAGPPFFDNQGNGQALKAIVNVGGPPNTACRDAHVPTTYVFQASDTIKSEITNKP